MNSVKVRTIHRRLGISIAFFLLMQALAGLLMSTGKLASVDTSKGYNVLYTLHADWDPLGSIYRIVLGLTTAAQGILGTLIFLNRYRHKGGEAVSSSPGPSYESRKKDSEGVLSFAVDIRPLFRDKDIRAMTPMGINLSSYEDVKKRAQDIYARLSSREMPCDTSWSDSQVRRLRDWMEGGLKP